jgi:hypothetical protein
MRITNNPGHALTYTRGSKAKNRPEKPILPTPLEVAILRRCAAGYIKVTLTEKGSQYSYDDGTELPLRTPRGDRHGTKHFQRLVSNGWLIPDADSLLPGGPPQVYRARKP